jgi:hypothetical protein
VLQADAEADEEAQSRRFALACLIDDAYLHLRYLARNVGAEVSDGVADIAEAAGFVKRQDRQPAPIAFSKPQ